MAEEKHKHCFNCRYYNPYYLRANIHFNKLDYGLCKRNGVIKPVEKHDYCTDYSGNYFYERIDGSIAVKKLAEAADAIVIVTQIIQEKIENTPK